MAGLYTNSAHPGTPTVEENSGDVVAPSTLKVNCDGNFLYAGTFADGHSGNTLSLVKDGVGSFTVLAASSNSGSTTVNAGILNIQNASALGSMAGGVEVASGATLQVQGGITVSTTYTLTLAGTGFVVNGVAIGGAGERFGRQLLVRPHRAVHVRQQPYRNQ